MKGLKSDKVWLTVCPPSIKVSDSTIAPALISTEYTLPEALEGLDQLREADVLEILLVVNGREH